MVPRLTGLLKASHPGPTVVVTAIAIALAIAVEHDGLDVALIGLAVLLGQVSIGWSNDWLDAWRDTAARRVDKPVAAGLIGPTQLRVAALTAGVCSVPLSFVNGPRAAVGNLALVLSGWAYNAGLKRTLWSWLPYATGFGMLPVFVTRGLPGAPWPPWWAITAAALLGVGAHFANVLPDIEQDLRLGVRGLPQVLGYTSAGLSAVAIVLSASAIVVLVPRGTGPTGFAAAGAALVVGLCVLAGKAIVDRTDPRRTFRYTMAVAAIDVLLLVDAATILQPKT